MGIYGYRKVQKLIFLSLHSSILGEFKSACLLKISMKVQVVVLSLKLEIRQNFETQRKVSKISSTLHHAFEGLAA